MKSRYGIKLPKRMPFEFGGSEPHRVGQWHQGDIHVFLNRINSITDFFPDSRQPDGSLTETVFESFVVTY